MKYNYYIAYQMSRGKAVINGNCFVECTNELNNKKDIEQMQEQTRKKLKAKKLMIFWWKLIK